MELEPFVERSPKEEKLRFRMGKTLGLGWDHLKAIATGVINNPAKLLWSAICLAILVFVLRDLSSDLITIEPISVPKTFSENGYTPEVTSRRLNDALNAYVKSAGSRMQSPSVAPRDELPKFIIPKIDLSIDAVVTPIRSFLNYKNRSSISGELIVHDRLAWLRLRVDGQEAYSSPAGFDPENFDAALAAAVPAVINRIRPYLVAAAIYDSDKNSALEKANFIIARYPSSDINFQWAHVLKGRFFLDQKDFTQAEAVLREAVLLNKLNPVAHNNLGNALRHQSKFDQAIAEYKVAIEIDPKFAYPHHNLAVALYSQGNLDGAMKELRIAMKIDPDDTDPHFVAGNILRDQTKLDEALYEYVEALKRDPQHTGAHNNLGIVFGMQHKLDEAISQFRLAIDSDRDNEQAKGNLEAALQLRAETLQ